MFASTGVGFVLILLALAFLVPVLAIVLLRRTSSKPFSSPQGDPSLTPLDSSNINEAVLLVQSGGRVEYVNGLARDWFGLHPEEVPDLEHMMRRAKPAEEFLGICAKPDQKRISIRGRLVEATSYQVPGLYAQVLVTMKAVEFSRDASEPRGGLSVLRLISDFGKDLSASLELNDVLHAALLHVSQLISSDMLEIKTWDATSQSFTTFILDPSDRKSVV